MKFCLVDDLFKFEPSCARDYERHGSTDFTGGWTVRSGAAEPTVANFITTRKKQPKNILYRFQPFQVRTFMLPLLFTEK